MTILRGGCMEIYFNKDELVDKIARFFEKEENWSKLKQCWLEDGRSNDLRSLLYNAIKE
jgi:hypothetical protein